MFSSSLLAVQLLYTRRCCLCRSFDKAFQYAKDGNHFRTASSVKQALEYPLFIKAIELLEVTSYYRVVSIHQACLLAVQFLDLLL